MSQAFRIVIVDSDAHVRTALRRMLDEIGNVHVVGDCEFAEAATLAGIARPDIVVVGVGDTGSGAGEAVRQIERLTHVLPGTTIVANGPVASGEFVIRVIRAGAVEYLGRPIDRAELRAAIDKLARVRPARPTPSAGRITAVYSLKGGLGATTLATNVAVVLAERLGHRTLLVELQSGPSDIAAALDLKPTYSVLDALKRVHQIDDAFLRGLLVRHGSGLFVLPAPLRAEHVPLPPDEVTLALEALKMHFEHIVLDVGHATDEGTLTALHACEQVLLITALNVIALRSSATALKALRGMGVDPKKVKLVIAREDTGEQVTVKTVRETMDVPVFWTTPSDYKAVTGSLDEGRPIVSASPRSKLAANFRQLAEALASSGQGTNGAAPRKSISMLRLAWGQPKAS